MTQLSLNPYHYVTWCWCHCQKAFPKHAQSLQRSCWHIAHYNHSCDTVLELQSLTCLLPLEFRSGSAVPILHLTTSDCNVQCMNRTRSPQPTVTVAQQSCHIYYDDWKCYCQTNNDAPAIAVQDRDKLTKNRTEQALCNRPMYIIRTVQHKQRKLQKHELKPRES